MLTGKCKEDFVTWFHNTEDGIMVYESLNTGDFQPYDQFVHLPLSMQYGVYVDFFDSVGILVSDGNIGDRFIFAIEYEVEPVDDLTRDTIISQSYNTRTEARRKAIEKASEIYNRMNHSSLINNHSS